MIYTRLSNSSIDSKLGSLNVVLWLQFQFFSEYLMIMVVVNWVILLAVSENLSHNFSSLKCESVWSLTLNDDNKNINGGGSNNVLWIHGRTYTH